jgi:glutaredoxin
MAKEFLSRNKISFVEKDINVDEEARVELANRNIKGVPTFFIGDDVVIGFDKQKILDLVDHRVIECENCRARMRVPIDKGNLTVTCPKCKHAYNLKPDKLI